MKQYFQLLIIIVAFSFNIILSQTIQYQNNNFNYIVNINYGNGIKVEYMYDALGNRISQSVTSSIFISPNLFYPTDAQKNLSTHIYFVWNKVRFAEKYHLQIAKDIDFNNLVFNDSSLADTMKYVTSLMNNTKYYWRVNASGTGIGYNWSGVRSFTTIISIPNIVMLSQPLNYSKNVSLAPVLKWNKSLGSENYILLVSKDSLFNNLILSDSSLTDTIKQVNSLANYSRYYWKITAKNIGGFSPASEVWCFTTIPPAPVIPVLALPVNGSKNIKIDPKFAWKGNLFIDRYRFRLSEDEQFTKIVVSDSIVSDTIKNLHDLKEGVQYYWNVSSINTAGESPYSEVWNFTTLVNAPDSLSANIRGNGRILLSWIDNSNGEEGFIIEKKTSGDFLILDSLKANQTTYLDSTALKLEKYLYRVKAYTSDAVSVYSDTASITITNLNSSLQVPTEYSLYQNYPNPFNPLTKIKYALPKVSHVKIQVYNLLGKVVKEPVNSEKSAGYYELNLNAGDLSSGIYFYSIEARSVDGSKNFRNVKKMIILK